VLALLLGLAVLAAGAPPAAATPAPGRADAAAADPAPLLLVGVTGLRWSDVDAEVAPALHALSRTGAVGSTVVRSARASACPSAGWLAVGAGGRADDPRDATGRCRTLLDPGPGERVPGWDDYQAAMAASAYDSALGLLGDAVAATGVAATGIGPGAAVALADRHGRPVGEHAPWPASPEALSDAVATALTGSDLVVVDAGVVRDVGQETGDRTDDAVAGDPVEGPDPVPGGSTVDGTTVDSTTVDRAAVRADRVRELDARVGAVLAAADRADPAPTVLVVSVADSGRRPHLQVAAARGPAPGASGELAGGTLGSSATRQRGLLQTTDVTPTVLDALGIRDAAPAGALVGSAVRVTADGDDPADRVAGLVDRDRRAQAVAPRVSGFYVLWVGLNLALYLGVTAGLTRRGLRRAPASARTAGRALRTVRAAAVVVAAVPVATFLAGLVPWWRAAAAGWVLAGLVAGFAGLVAALALAVPAWRDRPLGPLGVVSAVTALVLGTDVALGAHLALDSLMGPGSLVAGRFYGFGNPALALFATSALLGSVALVDPLLRRGRPVAAAVVVGAVGLVALGVVTGVVAAVPTTGANFGGPPALVAGFLALVVLTAGAGRGARLGGGALVAVVAAGVATSVAASVLDWLRPVDERTHLGRFVQTVLDGGLGTVLARKAGTNLRILLGSEQTLLAVGGLLLVVVLLGRPARAAARAPDGGAYAWLSGGAPLRQLFADAPALRGGLAALAVTLGVGFAINDSGVVIPATGVGLAVPLLVAACATWMLHRRAGTTALVPPAAPSAPAGRPGSGDVDEPVTGRTG
jgi:hypothetical protein